MSTPSAVPMAHVGTGADRDAQVGLGRGRGVVDSVADHGDFTTGQLQLGDLGWYVDGQ